MGFPLLSLQEFAGLLGSRDAFAIDFLNQVALRDAASLS